MVSMLQWLNTAYSSTPAIEEEGATLCGDKLCEQLPNITEPVCATDEMPLSGPNPGVGYQLGPSPSCKASVPDAPASFELAARAMSPTRAPPKLTPKAKLGKQTKVLHFLKEPG